MPGELKYEQLIARARKEALLGPEAGSNCAKLLLEIAEAYEITAKQALRLEATIHRLTK